MRILVQGSLGLAAILLVACVSNHNAIPYNRTNESIPQVFDHNWYDLFQVYKNALKTDPNLSVVRSLYKITLNPDGEVIRSIVVRTIPDDNEVAEEVNQKISKIKFGKVRYPRNITITYPIDFFAH